MLLTSNIEESPKNFTFPVEATLKGSYSYRVLDESGNPENTLSDEHGNIINYDSKKSFSNIITNYGLNRIPFSSIQSTSGGTVAGWRRYFAVGTGTPSMDPAVSTLNIEVQRSTGELTGSTSYILDTTANVFRATLTRVGTITMTEDRTLREFGFSDVSTSLVTVREFLRDETETPVSLFLKTGKTLVVTHNIVIEIPAPELGNVSSLNILEYDINDNLVSTTPYDIIYGFTSTVSNIFSSWNPALTSSQYISRVTSTAGYSRTSRPSGLYSTSVSCQTSEYIEGSYEREKFFIVPTNFSTYDNIWYGALLGTTSGAFNIKFINPPSFTKVSTHTFRVGLISTWGRV